MQSVEMFPVKENGQRGAAAPVSSFFNFGRAAPATPNKVNIFYYYIF